VEDFPWAEPWARVTTALSHAVAMLARELSWQGTAREYGLNWKSVATIVKRAVQYGRKHRKRLPVQVMGIDEVSRRKGQVYLTVVYDLERRVLLWVGDDRTEEAVRPFFTKEMGKRRCQTLQVVCMDMWAAYAKLVRDHAVNAQILFDRFHIVKHLNEAVDAARPDLLRQLTTQESQLQESQLQRNPLAAAEESLESEQRPEATAFHAGALEFAAGPRLVLEGILPTLLDLQAAVACQAASAQVDELGHAIEVGTIQEIRGHAPLSLGRSPRLDQNAAFERSR
jgi:transposase